MSEKKTVQETEEDTQSTDSSTEDSAPTTPEKEDEQPVTSSAFDVPDAPDVQKTNKYNLPLNDGSSRDPVMRGMGKTMMIALVALVIAALGVGIIWLTHDEAVPEDEPQQASQEVSPLGAAATFIEGFAEMHSGDENWTEIDSSLSLSEGDTVRTGSSSRLVITLDDGSAVRLNSNSEATLVTLNTGLVSVKNQSGEIYTRVVASDSREFTVSVGEDGFTAQGTAYKTSNTPEVKGVDVYHSSVSKDDMTIEEGKAFFTQHPDEKKQGVVSDINLNGLEDDEFIAWNAELDKSETDFADKLGVLEGIEKDDDEKPEPDTPSPSPSPSASISASASKTSSGVKVNWTVDGVNTADGFKVVYSTATSTPTYGVNSSHYVGGKDARSAFIELTDGKTYNVRVCAYRPAQSSCDSYSNTVQVTAPVVQKDPVLSGTVAATLSGDTMSWSLTGGNAPYGFKVVYKSGSGQSPTYPADNPSYTGDTSKDLSKLNLSSGTYTFRVCKYTNNTQATGCVDYSNPVEYVVP